MGRRGKSVRRQLIGKVADRLSTSIRQGLPALSKSVLRTFLVAALALNLLSTGFPALIDQYKEHQARTPHPLASDTTAAGAPAADTEATSGKADSIASVDEMATPASTSSITRELVDAVANHLENQAGDELRELKFVRRLDEGRTANDRVWLNRDGTRSLEHSQQPTSYQENGQWKDVDAGLAQDPRDGKWKTKANSWQARFGTISGSAGVELGQDAQTLSFKPVGGGQINPVVTGVAPHQIVKYPNVWPNVDLMYQLTGGELKESIVLKSRSAANTFSFDLAGANLTPDPDNPGGFKLDGQLGDFRLAAPTIATATDGILGAAPIVRQELVGGRLVITLDRSWMDRQGSEKFPLVIDPSFWASSGPNSWYKNFKSDGYICNPGQGCGNSAGNASNQYWRFAFHVDFSQVSGAYLVGAALHLEMPNPDGVHFYGTYDPRWIYMDHAGCLTGFNCIDGSYGETSGLLGSSGEFDVTPQFRTAVNGGDWGTWMMVRAEEVPNYGTYKLFAYDQTRVWLNYDKLPSASTLAAGSPADGGVAISTQPTFKSTVASDVDGPGPMMYRYRIGTTKTGAGGGTAPSIGGVLADSGDNITPKWTMPDNVLQDGTTYYWQVQVWDSYVGAVPSYSPVYSFKVDLRNGQSATQAYDTNGPVSVDLGTGNLTTSAKSHQVAALGGDLGVSLSYNSPQRSRQGLVAQYWNNTAQSGAPVLTRVEPAVDYDWGNSMSPYAGLVSRDDDIPLRQLLGQMVPDAAELLDTNQEELRRLLDRATSMAAVAIYYERARWLDRSLDTLVRIYELGFDQHGFDRGSPAVVWLWLDIVTRVYALGGLAVRERAWESVRVLADRRPAGEAFSHYGSWLRHAFTMAARARIFETEEKAGLLARAHNVVRSIDSLHPDRPADDEAVLTSLCQFDLYAALIVIGERGSLSSGNYYPSFARYYSRRTTPAFVTIVNDKVVRQKLFDGSDSLLGDAIAEIDEHAQKEGFSYDGWGGIEDGRVRQFVEQHRTPSP